MLSFPLTAVEDVEAGPETELIAIRAPGLPGDKFAIIKLMVKRLFLFLIRFYQKTWFARVAVFGEGSCRFSPSCSQYTYEAIKKYGILKGCILGLKRVVRCHPWSKGGDDPLQ